MNIDEFVLQSKRQFLNPLKSYSDKKALSVFKSSWDDIVEKAKTENKEKELLKIINRKFGTNYTNLDQISRKKPILESFIINEDFKNFWKFVKIESWPVITIFPSLQVWFEIDKLLFGNGDIDEQKIAFYGSFWLIMITGNFVKQWNKWRKENPEEYEKEGKRKNPFALGKKMNINEIIEKHSSKKDFIILEKTKIKINPNKYKDYDKFFKAMLNLYGIKNVKELNKKERINFFKEIENIWKSKEE